MSGLFGLFFLALILWIGVRFVYFYRASSAVGVWARVVDAAGDSATYFVAKATMFGSAILGLVAAVGDFFATTPEAKYEFNQWLSSYTNPTAVAFGLLSVMALIWWARGRTKA